MAHINLIHNVDDAEAANRLADIFYFLDYEVNLLSREFPEPAVQQQPANTHGDDLNIMFVLWTQAAQKDRWIAAQCRELEDPELLITLLPKESGSVALPLMLHRGSVVRSDYGAGRMRLSSLQDLLSEIGLRTGRHGLVSGVAALMRSNDEERASTLSKWLTAYPDDPLSPTVEAVLRNNTTHEIHRALVDVVKPVVVTSSSIKEMAGGVASRVKLPVRIGPLISYAAIAVVAGGAFLATLLPIINRPAETVEIDKISGPLEVAERVAPAPLNDPELPAEANVQSVDTAPGGDAPVVDVAEAAVANEVFDAEAGSIEGESSAGVGEPLEATGDIESEAESLAAMPDASSLDAEQVADVIDRVDAEEPSLGVPDPVDFVPEPVVDEPLEKPITPEPNPEPVIEEAVPEAQTEDAVETAAVDADENTLEEDVQVEAKTETEDLDAAAPQTELLLPYILGEQGPGDSFTDRLSDESGAPIMVIIPSGNFEMGSPLSERGRYISEGPQRRVSVSRNFAVSKFEVSVAEFEKFVSATSYDASDECKTYADDAWVWESGTNFESPGYRQSGDHPVTCIDWQAAQAYTEWLSEETGARYRLLSEAEWEYVARAGSSAAYPFGQDANEGCTYLNGADKSASSSISSSIALTCSDGAAFTAPVGSYLPNDFGVYDMNGNVWEWTEDRWYESYEGASRTSRARVEGDNPSRVIRGGSWFDFGFDLRSASRDKFESSQRRNNIGFRIARDL